MNNIEYYKSVFERYGGMMRTKELQAEKIFYRSLQGLAINCLQLFFQSFLYEKRTSEEVLNKTFNYACFSNHQIMMPT
jgi:hypothetical protein